MFKSTIWIAASFLGQQQQWRCPASPGGLNVSAAGSENSVCFYLGLQQLLNIVNYIDNKNLIDSKNTVYELFCLNKTTGCYMVVITSGRIL